MQLVIHAPFGARINRAWGLALRKRFCRSFNFELQAAATDNGIVISLGEQHSFPLEIVFEFLRVATVEDVLTQALLPAPMFTARWRWNASRALAIPRYTGGRKIPPPIQRMRADDLMAAVFPDQAACPENLAGEVRIPDHPLVKETIDNCLHEAMDLDGLKRLLADIAEGRVAPSPSTRPSRRPSPTRSSTPIRTRISTTPRSKSAAPAPCRCAAPCPPIVAAGAAALDPAAIAQVASEVWPPMRDADELHEALLSFTIMPAAPLAALRRTSRRQPRHDAHHRRPRLLGRRRAPRPRPLRLPAIHHRPRDPRRSHARAFPIRPSAAPPKSCAAGSNAPAPKTADDFVRDLALPRDLVDQALAQLEAEGQILRGTFTPGATGLEWCHRRLLARIHRLTIGRLRREIEPVTTAEFYAFLNRWQHLAPGTQLHGVDGTLQVIRQLQGSEFAAAAWETVILPRRIARYDPEYLDQLCLSGEVSWGRLSPHPAFDRPRDDEDGSRGRRVRPTRVAPLAIFLREDADWLLATPQPSPKDSLSHPAREVLDVLETRGASFFADLTRATGRLASEVEDALWELVAAGLVTADGFENLRALLDPKRRRGEGKGRTARPRHAPGRWALLRHSGASPKVTPKPSRASFCNAGASSSATPRSASPWRRRGASCWWCCAAWNRAARFAAAVSSMPLSASSSRCPKRSTFSAPSAAPAKRPRNPTYSQRPHRPSAR